LFSITARLMLTGMLLLITPKVSYTTLFVLLGIFFEITPAQKHCK
jgi:uncharacterized membrane protein HdeD (DUF308 family)